MDRRRVLVALLVYAGVVAAAGCAAAAWEPTAGSRDEAVAESTVRTDPEPIARRFPGLGSFTAVHWVGGTVGDDRVPGPSLYFIEAVVQLAPADAERLRTRPDLGPVAAPQPAPPLRDFLPAAGSSAGAAWAASEQLQRDLAPEHWSARLSLLPDTDLAYLSARGE